MVASDGGKNEAFTGNKSQMRQGMDERTNANGEDRGGCCYVRHLILIARGKKNPICPDGFQMAAFMGQNKALFTSIVRVQGAAKPKS